MVTGWKEDSEGEVARAGGFVALVVALLVAVAVVYGASGAWLSPRFTPAAVETPDI